MNSICITKINGGFLIQELVNFNHVEPHERTYPKETLSGVLNLIQEHFTPPPPPPAPKPIQTVPEGYELTADKYGNPMLRKVK